MTSWAMAWWSGLTLSTSVTACESTVTSPLMIPSTISAVVKTLLRNLFRFRYGLMIEGCCTPELTVSPLYSSLFSGCSITLFLDYFTLTSITTFEALGSLVIMRIRGCLFTPFMAFLSAVTRSFADDPGCMTDSVRSTVSPSVNI